MTGSPIRLEELGAGDLELSSDGTSALDLAQRPYTTLRFRIDADPDSLEALRHARRTLLREEWTLGLESDEPSLGEAVFSPTEIAWRVPQDQRKRCLQKLAELTARAERARQSSSAADLPTGPRGGNTREE